MDISNDIEIRRRTRQKHMNLVVKPDGKIRVSCNRTKSIREIYAFVSSCESFIEKRRRELAEENSRFPTKQFLTGDKFLFGGVEHELNVIWTFKKRPKVLMGPGATLELLCPVTATPQNRQKALVQFFRGFAERVLRNRVEVMSEVMGLKVNSVSVRGQKTLWGSCSGPGDISLNWKLICAPPECLEYVVVHELCHIVERNHSPKFWRLVEKYSPHWKTHKAWLRSHESRLAREHGFK